MPGTFRRMPETFFGSLPSSMMSKASVWSTITIEPDPCVPTKPLIIWSSYGCILTLRVGDDLTVLNSMTDLSSFEISATS